MYEPDLPSPLQLLQDPLWHQAGVKLYVKRDDLISPLMPGNKWRKLKFFVQQLQQEGYSKIITFGGAYSNHLRAVAGAGKIFGFQTIGMVRGEEHNPLNPALQFCKDLGMQLHYIDRDTYRKIREPETIKLFQNQFGPALIVPDGGHSVLGSMGVADIVHEIPQPFDHIVTACATGTTLAGLAHGLQNSKSKALGIAVLKGANFLYEDTQTLLNDKRLGPAENWDINLDYHFGGYAKTKPALEEFITSFQNQHHIALDHVYTGKMFFALYDLLKAGFFQSGQTVIALHTGGFPARWTS